MATKILNWPASLKILVKIALMVLCCFGLCTIPLFMQRSIIRSFVVSGSATVSSDVIGPEFYKTMSGWFTGFIVLMFAVNLVFFIIDTIKSDTVRWRRKLQVILNVLIIVAGIVVGWYLIFGYYYYMSWWKDVLFSDAFLRRLRWFPYLIFAASATFQMIWDLWLFAADNRNPWILRILHSEAMKGR